MNKSIKYHVIIKKREIIKIEVIQQLITTNKMANNQKDKPIKVVPTLAKTLINNDSCVVAATKFPWWIALIVYILSIGISFIPAVVQSGTTKGNYLLTSTMYSVDSRLFNALLLNSSNISFLASLLLFAINIISP